MLEAKENTLKDVIPTVKELDKGLAQNQNVDYSDDDKENHSEHKVDSYRPAELYY